MSTHADPTIYDCIELPDSEKGDECQLWTGDEPTPCEQPTAYVFVHEASTTRDDDKRRNVVACEDCAPAPDEYRSESNPAGGAAER